MAKTVMLAVGNKRVTTVLETLPTGTNGERRIFARYNWAPELNAELKSAFAARWDPDSKRWHFEDNHHNHFRLRYMQGLDPYAPYDAPLIETTSKRGLFKHQLVLKSFGITRRQCIMAAEPGTGKSLSLIEIAEWLNEQPLLLDDHNVPIPREFWWVAPKAALFSVELEAIKWNSQVTFKFMTYDRMKAEVSNWKPGKPAPQLVGFDEASRLKNATSDRSKSARYLADKMRDEYGREACVILMSGTPAPQSPVDWFSLMQIAVPGYLKEGNFWKFQENLCKIKDVEARTGGSYPKLVTWYDNETKCKECGQLEVDILHTNENHPEYHKFDRCSNEVARLYQRMQGAVYVLRKKDCLDLPEKIFKRVVCEMPQSMIRAAKMITKSVGTGARALSLLRELSDGFQYQDFESGEKECDLCSGSQIIEDMVYIGPAPTDDYLVSLDLIPGVDTINTLNHPELYEHQAIACTKCKGLGTIPRMLKGAQYVGSPKDEAMGEIMDEYEEHGRLVVYGAFQATVDNLVKIAEGRKWDWIKADGRSWASSMGGSPLTWLADFENRNSLTKKLIFIGQPEAAGMGLTLTAACAAVFYSNSFNAESRLQAIERIHRTGASKELGVTIIDLIGLPTDAYVLDKLDAKEELQAITMGSLEKCLDQPLFNRNVA